MTITHQAVMVTPTAQRPLLLRRTSLLSEIIREVDPSHSKCYWDLAAAIQAHPGWAQVVASATAGVEE